MLSKDEVISKLKRSNSYVKTHRIIDEREQSVQWTQEEVAQLIRIAADNEQVMGTLDYKGDCAVRDFYLELLGQYTGDVNAEVNKVMDKVLIPNTDIANFLREERDKIAESHQYDEKIWRDRVSGMRFSICDGLYHANSVATVLSYIKNQKMYSRQYGDTFHREEQTGQWSDEIDKRYGIYNDIFFDNCDCRLVANAQSVYGPITLVLDEKILKDEKNHIRITKSNPGMDERDWATIPYAEKFFTSLEELKDCAEESGFPFRTRFAHHTTLWNKDYIELTPDVLKYIFVERNPNVEISLEIKRLLESELRSGELRNTPVIIRSNVAEAHHRASNTEEELWRIPE